MLYIVCYIHAIYGMMYTCHIWEYMYMYAVYLYITVVVHKELATAVLNMGVYASHVLLITSN